MPHRLHLLGVQQCPGWHGTSATPVLYGVRSERTRLGQTKVCQTGWKRIRPRWGRILRPMQSMLAAKLPELAARARKSIWSCEAEVVLQERSHSISRLFLLKPRSSIVPCVQALPKCELRTRTSCTGIP